MMRPDGAELTIALGRYDRTDPVIDGRVPLPGGYRASFVSPPTEEMFSEAFERGTYDASELSFSNFLRHAAAGTGRYVGLPVFPSRSFRHGTLYVRRGGPVRTPGDLEGRRVGVREYAMTAALAARGALRDQYGVDTDRLTWVAGDVDTHERATIPLPRLHRPIALDAAEGRLLADMLVGGEIDALLAYKPPAQFGDGTGPIRRLFDDVPEAEAAFFAASRIFPIMHLVGLRRDNAEADPGLGTALYEALAEAGRLALANLGHVDTMRVALPWVSRERERTVAVMGEDYWPSGLRANRTVLARMIAWSFTDGLIPTMPDVDELMLPSLRHT